MKRALLLLAISLAVSPLRSQLPLDSLLAVWQDESAADTARVEAYKTYIWYGLASSHPDSALTLAKELYRFSSDIGYTNGKAQGEYLMAVTTRTLGNPSRAIAHFYTSLSLYEETGTLNGIASCLQSIGSIYLEQGHSAKALEFQLRGLSIFEEVNDQFRIASVLTNINGIYSSQEEFDKALEYQLRALKILEALDAKSEYAYGLGNLGAIHAQLGDYGKGLDYLNKSLELQEQLGDQQQVAPLLFNIGFIYRDRGELDTAMQYLSRAQERFETARNQLGIGRALGAIASISLLQNNYSEALDYCENQLLIAERLSNLFMQKEACQCLYDSYKALGRTSDALVYLEKTQMLDDSLSAGDTRRKLQQMEFAKQVYQDSVETAEKQRLVEEAHQKEVRRKNHMRNVLLGTGALLLLLAGGAYSRLTYVRKSKATLQKEKDRSENLLLNILPEEIAEELKEKGQAEARDFELVSILFTDFKGFTSISEKLSAQDLVAEINTCFKAFDQIIAELKIEKIKTIGDAYMAAGGLPVPDSNSVKNTVLAALAMQDFISKRKRNLDQKDMPAFEMRVGVHTGPVVAGIVGVKKFQYDIWGDTVNIASRMESSGAIGQVNISQSTYELLQNDPDLVFESRGRVEAKGKGVMEMYFVSRKS